jgi:hypothetical protein
MQQQNAKVESKVVARRACVMAKACGKWWGKKATMRTFNYNESGGRNHPYLPNSPLALQQCGEGRYDTENP